MSTFEELGVSEPVRRAIEEMGFENPMPVQEEVIPYLLGTRNDVIALAQTGTGKTAAFGIPILQRIDTASNETQALILSPTRELCLQIADDLRDFSKYLEGIHIEAVYGGASITQQIHALKKGVHIIVATPGRLIDLMNRDVAHLDKVTNVVLDEADEMLNMGFSESIDAILEGVPEERNTLLFSATMSREIERIAQGYLHDYKEIVVGSRNEGAENVNHVYYMVNAKDKYLALKRIVDFYPKIFAIIFCRTRTETQEVADKLIRDGYNAEALHGELVQGQRDITMQKFRQHVTQLLVATDVAARGLDVDDLTHVINYGLPDEIESYIHRSGRTGRAGKKGTSISIIHSRETRKLKAIEKELGKEFVEGVIPAAEEICKKQLFKVMDHIVKIDVEEEQIAPFMTEINRYFEFIDKDELIKKIVSMEFGKFLAYYADAPEIETVKKERSKREKRQNEGKGKSGEPRATEAGFRRLFINVGKMDGMYPSELMKFLNRHVKGQFEVGHIDLLPRFAYFEVPEAEAKMVMQALDGVKLRGRDIRCNEADESPSLRSPRGGENLAAARELRGGKAAKGESGRKAAKGERGGREEGGRKSVKGERGGRKNSSGVVSPGEKRGRRSGRADRFVQEEPQPRRGRKFKKEDWLKFLKK
ncbi:MAG: DEAD/DEAH box helicase [Bacteroidaceae bacterium]|nr:DEAD/DEAH box helicase [Bacteroidaceae bacterium]